MSCVALIFQLFCIYCAQACDHSLEPFELEILLEFVIILIFVCGFVYFDIVQCGLSSILSLELCFFSDLSLNSAYF